LRYAFYVKLMHQKVDSQTKLRETTMRQFTLSIVALAAFGVMLTSAQADSLNGAPLQKGNQCFKFAGGERDSRWGYWGDCPQTASVAVAPRHVRRHHASSR
jgi:hypothetical protein